MSKKSIFLSILLILFPLTAFCDCTEQCYTSECETSGMCEMICENNICYYYDSEGTCWKYDKDKGYYPCGCECYKCNDSCFDNDRKCKDCDCGDCCYDWDDCCDDDYSCFICVIKPEKNL
jgi:hypothetical protein